MVVRDRALRLARKELLSVQLKDLRGNGNDWEEEVGDVGCFGRDGWIVEGERRLHEGE